MTLSSKCFFLFWRWWGRERQRAARVSINCTRVLSLALFFIFYFLLGEMTQKSARCSAHLLLLSLSVWLVCVRSCHGLFVIVFGYSQGSGKRTLHVLECPLRPCGVVFCNLFFIWCVLASVCNLSGLTSYQFFGTKHAVGRLLL